MERLSTLYNADVGLYMLANKVLIFSLIIFIFALFYVVTVLITFCFVYIFYVPNVVDGE